MVGGGELSRLPEAAPARLAKEAANLKRVVTATFGVRGPDLDPFVLAKNSSLDLLLPGGDRTTISVGSIHAMHAYLWVTVDGRRQQLYVGKRMEFGPRRSPCTVELRAIDESRLEGTFDYRWLSRVAWGRFPSPLWQNPFVAFVKGVR